MTFNPTYIALLLVPMLGPGALGDEYVQLDPDRPHVCSRYTYQVEIMMVNVSSRCFVSEWDTSPCRDSYYYYPRRHRHYHRRRYGKRDVTNPTPGPGETDHPYSGNKTDGPPDVSKTTTSTDAPVEDSSRRCCRRVESVCWRLQLRVVRSRVVEPICCRGYEPDITGGCIGSIECSVNNGGCDHMCYFDDDEGHRCGCFNGYELANRTICRDIDECDDGNGGCSDDCSNADGGYDCTCPSGYELTIPTECQEVNECMLGNGGCDQECYNTDGGFYCQCEEGFRLTEGYRCQDIDECSEPSNGGCSHYCANEYGDFQCTCPEGWSLDSEDGFQCFKDDPEGPGEPDALPSTTLAELFTQPVAVGSMIGVASFVLLLIIVAILCVCCCRKQKPTKKPEIFMVSKGKMADVEGTVAQKKIGASSPVVVASLLSDKIAKETPCHVTDDFRLPGGDLPTYDEVVMSKADNYAKTLDRKYMKPTPCPDETANVYANLAYSRDNPDPKPKEEMTGGGIHDEGEKESDNEKKNPYDDVISNLRRTGSRLA